MILLLRKQSKIYSIYYGFVFPWNTYISHFSEYDTDLGSKFIYMETQIENFMWIL